jgi:serine/threonine-protein kinase HipA
MTIHGKREGITREDLLAVAREMNVKGAAGIIDAVSAAVSQWRECAVEAGVPPDRAGRIGGEHRLL